MNLRICPSKIRGTINAIPSKSYAHRIAILNFFAGNDPSCDCGGFTSEDIKATTNCLLAIKKGERTIDCGESGSTLRFLLPCLAAVGGEFEFIGHGKLMQRPNEELFKVLNEHGVKVESGERIKISGKLTGGEYFIKGDISSQYISGLLMALPYVDTDSKIVLTTPLASSPYVDITLELLDKYGIKTERTDYGFFVKGGQKYSGNALPEGDYSNAAFFLVLGALAGKITVKGLLLNSVQGDKYVLKILKDAGAKIKTDEKGITVKKSKLKAFSFSAKSCPDLVPIACVLASAANGKSVIYDVERLKIKESDRIESTISMLSAFGIKAESDGKSIFVYGGKLTGGKADSFNDHRIAMSVAVLAAAAKGDSFLTDALAVNKSYPNFFKDYYKVGGKIFEI